MCFKAFLITFSACNGWLKLTMIIVLSPSFLLRGCIPCWVFVWEDSLSVCKVELLVIMFKNQGYQDRDWHIQVMRITVILICCNFVKTLHISTDECIGKRNIFIHICCKISSDIKPGFSLHDRIHGILYYRQGQKRSTLAFLIQIMFKNIQVYEF